MMMTDITWGPEILVGGVRPDWLADDVGVQFHNTGAYIHRWSETRKANKIAYRSGEVDTTTIRLPADHFAYVAIDKGFTPWGGGDAAPADWDGGDVLMRDGIVWPHSISWWTHDGGGAGKQTGSDVIGYRKRADTVTVPRLTLADVSEAREGYFASGLDDSALFYARRWGLLPPETLAERFTRETGHEVTDAVLAALNWSGK